MSFPMSARQYVMRSWWSIPRLLLALVLLLPAWAAAQESPALDRGDAFNASQAVLGRTPADHALLDREGRPVRLSSLLGKPALVSFIYTGCFQVCPASTRALDEAVGALQTRFGAGAFRVASIGFNQPDDSPQAMKAFAAQHRIARDNWDFLSAPAPVVPALTRDFGFRYAATPAGFDHVLQVTLLDAEGRIVRQVYGERPAAEELGESMQRLLAGQPVEPAGVLAQLVERVRILCTVYDPETGSYRVDYSLAWEIAGGLTFILSLALYMLNEWRVRRMERRHAPVAQRA
jgi:protein SCO1